MTKSDASRIQSSQVRKLSFDSCSLAQFDDVTIGQERRENVIQRVRCAGPVCWCHWASSHSTSSDSSNQNLAGSHTNPVLIPDYPARILEAKEKNHKSGKIKGGMGKGKKNPSIRLK